MLTLTPRQKIDLRDAHAIRREIGAVYRDTRAGRMAPQVATRLTYILRCLMDAYETCVLQDRLEKIEKAKQHKED